jgi:hypothetical protein
LIIVDLPVDHGPITSSTGLARISASVNISWYTALSIETHTHCYLKDFDNILYISFQLKIRIKKNDEDFISLVREQHKKALLQQ